MINTLKNFTPIEISSRFTLTKLLSTKLTDKHITWYATSSECFKIRYATVVLEVYDDTYGDYFKAFLQFSNAFRKNNPAEAMAIENITLEEGGSEIVHAMIDDIRREIGEEDLAYMLGVGEFLAVAEDATQEEYDAYENSLLFK